MFFLLSGSSGAGKTTLREPVVASSGRSGFAVRAADPQLFAGPIRGPDDDGWAWDRWESWQKGDPRWSSFVLDRSCEPIDESADRLAAWIEEQRRLRGRGELPLSGEWWREQPA